MRLGLNESRKGLFRKERGRSLRAKAPKTEKKREPAAESLVGLRNLEAESIRSRAYEYGRVYNM